MRILIVEDEEIIAADIARALAEMGYVPEVVHDGEEADFRGFSEDYDAVILDLGLPRMDGLSVLRNWRRQGRGFPVLVLTARGGWREKVEGMDAGGDDYLSKPFEMEELLARIRALIRRSRGLSGAVLECGPLRLDTRTARVTLKDRALAVSPLEYRFLNYMMHNAGRVVPRMELMEHIHDDMDGFSDNALEALVARLRRKIGRELLRTRRGVGYVMACDGGEA